VKKVAEGEFKYAGGTRVEVKFSKPTQAKFFKLVSKSEINGARSLRSPSWT